jgi:IS5 family transposase
VPDATTLPGFRHLPEAQGLTERIFDTVNAGLRERGLRLSKGSVTDATIIAAPPSTKNRDNARDPEMHQTKKGNRWHFGMKAHIDADADSGLVHSLTCTAANVADVNETAKRLHGEEAVVFADAGYTGAEPRAELKDRPVKWHIAMTRGRLKAMAEGALKDLTRRAERLKAPCGQEPLRSPQGPLHGAEEEHRPVLHPVRPGQSGDRQEAPVGLMHPRCAQSPGKGPANP